MTAARPGDEEPTRPIEEPAPSGASPDKPVAPDVTAPFDPFTDDDFTDDDAGGGDAPDAPDAPAKPRIDETVLHDPVAEETQVIPPGGGSAAWAGRAGVPVPPPPRDAAYPMAEPPAPRTWWTPVLLGLLALVLLGVVVLVAWLMSRQTTPEPTATPTVPATFSPTPSVEPTAASPTPSPTPTPTALVQIPADLVGMSQEDAVAELGRLGLGYSFEFQDSAAPENEVIATRPQAQELVPAGSSVTLVISKGGLSQPTPGATATSTPNP